MSKIFGHIKRLFLEILSPFLFFFIAFNLVLITRTVSLKQYGITVPASAIAVIASLIIAKVVLIANRIPFLNLYPRKPLIYNVLLKTIIYSVVTMLFLVLEQLIHMARKDGGFGAAWARITTETVWSIFWLKQTWIFVLILFYCTGSEFIRVIGKEKVREILFGVKKVT